MGVKLGLFLNVQSSDLVTTCISSRNDLGIFIWEKRDFLGNKPSRGVQGRRACQSLRSAAPEACWLLGCLWDRGEPPPPWSPYGQGHQGQRSVAGQAGGARGL